MPVLQKVLYGGNISEGKLVYDFEQRFSDFIGHQNILSFNSSTAALHTALFLAGVCPGNEVISIAMSAEPTNIAILHAGSKVVWADVDPYNGNLSPESVNEAMTEKTKAIMIVHYRGVPIVIGFK